jgi:4-diphosphocytidyl-2-C-methyl-D-erythritol kinase
VPFAKVAPRIGADVPVCIDPRPRRMRGIGEVLSAPLKMPKLAAVMVNPGVAVPTRDVFMRLGLKSGGAVRRAAPSRELSRGIDDFVKYLARYGNDLEAPAVEIQPVIADVLAGIRKTKGCLLARMSGSGATCFGIFETPRTAKAAAQNLSAAHPKWWVRATTFG